MLENGINNIINENQSNLLSLGEKFLLKDLQNSDLHPSIIKYILSKIDDQLFLDRQFIIKKSIFDYSGKKIETYFDNIAHHIKTQKEFDSAIISKMIKEAVEFNSIFLCQPNQALLSFVFDEKKSKTSHEISARLKYLYYYKYLQKIIFSYLRKKEISKVGRKEFALLLKKIDSISKKTHIQNMMNTAVNSMADFFDHNEKESQKIPYNAIIKYLEEKELSNFSQRLDLKYEYGKPKTISIDELKLLFQSDFDGIDISNNKNLDSFESNMNIVNDEILDVVENKDENIISLKITEDIENNRIIELIEPDEENSTPNLTEKNNTEIEYTNEPKSIVEKDDEIEIESSSSKEKRSVQLETSSETNTQNKEIIKPDIKKLVRNLIDLNPIYDSLLSKQMPFENKNFLAENDSHNFINSLNYQFDVSTLCEDLVVEIPIDDEYIGIVKHEESLEFNEHYTDTEPILVAKDEDFRNTIKEELKIENEINIESETDFNDAIDEIVRSKTYAKELDKLNSGYDLDELDNDEPQQMTNLIADERLKLSEDEDEITEVFTDLSFLDKVEENEQESDEITNEELISDIQDSEYNNNQDNSNDNVKVIYSTFQEMISAKEMTNIIETMFDYDMEDYYQLIGSISNSSTEKEGLEITNKYCKENHIEITHNDVIEFKTYITDFFTQT